MLYSTALRRCADAWEFLKPRHGARLEHQEGDIDRNAPLTSIRLSLPAVQPASPSPVPGYNALLQRLPKASRTVSLQPDEILGKAVTEDLQTRVDFQSTDAEAGQVERK